VCGSSGEWLVVAGILLAIFVVPAVLRARRRRPEPPPDAGIRVKFLHDDEPPRDR